MKKRRPKKKCEAKTPICSGELIHSYSVNGSKKEGVTFSICGPCMVYLKRSGAKFEEV